MIKSDFGTIEINGSEPVVMAEFGGLLGVLRKVLGEKKYNLVMQRANNSKQFGDEPEEKEADFEPYLSLESGNKEIANYGHIGEETSICDIAGKKLRIGDTVSLYSRIFDNGKLSFRGEYSVVKIDNSEFVMGLRGTPFDRGVSCDTYWVIVLNRRHTEVEDGETVDGIKYIKSERTGE